MKEVFLTIALRLVYGSIGFFSALGSSLATMEGGMSLTVSQIAQIPLLAWILAMVAGLMGIATGKLKKGEVQ